MWCTVCQIPDHKRGLQAPAVYHLQRVAAVYGSCTSNDPSLGEDDVGRVGLCSCSSDD